MAQGPKDVVFGFQTRGVASFAHTLDPTASVAAPDSGSATSRPVVVVNQKGEVLFPGLKPRMWSGSSTRTITSLLPAKGTPGRCSQMSQAALTTASNGDFTSYDGGSRIDRSLIAKDLPVHRQKLALRGPFELSAMNP